MPSRSSDAGFMWHRPSFPQLHPTTLDTDAEIRKAFERARGELIELLAPYPRLQAVGLIRRGYEHDADENPLVVLITGSVIEPRWASLQSQVRCILARHGADEADMPSVELLRARVGPPGSTCTCPPHRACASSTIGVKNLSWSSASVGGYVRLTADRASLKPDDPRHAWLSQTYALTCHQALRPTRTEDVPDEDTCYDPALDAINVRHPPVPPPTGSEPHHDLPIQQPCPRQEEIFQTTAQSAIDQEWDNIKKLGQEQEADTPENGQRYEQAIVESLQYVDHLHQQRRQDPLFGHVFATSGYRVDPDPVHGFPHGCSLDWGLVAVKPARVRDNQIPELAGVPGDFAFLNLVPGQHIVETAEIQPGMVCKGRPGGTASFGLVSADRFSLFNQAQHGGGASVDWVVTDYHPRRFGHSSDAGAWVFDRKGRLVGLVAGEAKRVEVSGEIGPPKFRREKDFNTWHYVVPIKAVFRDIGRVTGCRVELELEHEGGEDAMG